jgi:ribonuclease P protein component
LGRAAPLGRLKRRAEFLRIAAQGRKFSTPGLVLQAAMAGAPEPRVGFTCSRKVGGAVERNRARRRLRAAAAQVMGEAAPGRDYVLIGRAATLRRPYALLLQDLRLALDRVGALRADATAGLASQGSEGSPE